MRAPKILFWLHKSQANRLGLAPLKCRITVFKGGKKEYSTGIQIPVDCWDTERKRAINWESAAAVNSKIKRINGDLLDTIDFLTEQNRQVSAEAIIEAYQQKGKPAESLLSAIDRHNKYFKARIGQKDFSEKTYKKYESFKNTIEDYLMAIQQKDILLININYRFVENLETWLLTKGKKLKQGREPLKRDSASNHLKKLKKILSRAVVDGEIKRNPFEGFKIPIEDLSRPFLTEYELSIFLSYEAGGRFQKTKDRFIVQCWTGLSQSDLDNLTKSQIHRDTLGRSYIETKRKKTGEICLIPLFPVVEQIFSKYSSLVNDNQLIMPKVTNQTMNRHLKLIASACGLKQVSTNTGRHTFATMMLNNGVTDSIVSNMLGHSSTRQLSHYARLRDSIIVDEATKAYNRILNKKQP